MIIILLIIMILNNNVEINLDKYNNENKILIRLSNNLNIDKKYLNKIILLNYWINFNNLLNHHIPISKYACILYIISKIYKLNISKINISTTCNVSNVTISKCNTKLEEYYENIKLLLNNT